MLTYAAITPHPPAIIPQIKSRGRHQTKKTISAMESLAADLKKYNPETILIISPHGPMRYDKFTVNLENSFWGNFEKFGAEKEDFRFTNNVSLAKELFSQTRQKNLPVEIIRETELDRGTLIPLFYLLQKYEKKPKIVPLTYTAFDWEMHFRFGQLIGQVIDESETEIALIASGELSHRLTDDSPAGFSPYGKKFDQTLINLLINNQTEKIKKLNPEFCEEAGECGLRSILMTLGALAHHRTSFQQLSYESPLGVGYLVGKWKIS